MKPKLRRLIEGLQLIERHDPNAEIDAHHDELLAGTLSTMNAGQVAQMEALGWRAKEQYDCWAIFT